MTNPIWIVVEGGDLFEGHQGHWADCFFSNATKEQIVYACSEEGGLFGEDAGLLIREMTDEEVAQYPEAVEFRDQLIREYGEA